MTDRCLGFEDLVWATLGRGWTEPERLAFEALDQEGRNAWVRARAAAAGEVIEVEDRVGTDGVLYAAFGLRRPSWFDALAWSRPVALADATPADLPEAGGVLVASVDAGPLVPGKVRAVMAVSRLTEAADRLADAARDLASTADDPAPSGASHVFVRWVIADDAAELAVALERHLMVTA